MIKSERGVITIDFMFSLILVSGFSFIIFALSLTLSITEVIQYITYSSARTFFAANMNLEAQQTAAYIKYQRLTNEDALRPLLEGGWFELSDLTISSDLPSNKPALSDYQQDEPKYNLFHGTVVYFVSKVLDFTIPSYGSTASDELRDSDEFGAYIGSYLGREVTQQECENMVRARWEEIQKLNVSGAAPYSTAGQNTNEYVGIFDNGC